MIIVVTATITMIAVYTSPDTTPDVAPTPATIKPTSPLDTIPIPTLIALLLSLRNIIEGNPQPSILVAMAIETRIPAISNTSRLMPRKSTCAPIIAKNNGAKIICNL